MDKNTFYADSEAPIVMLSAKTHFDELPNDNAKLYAHYLSRASHWGTRVVIRSVSPESEDIYDLILLVHKKLGEPSSPSEYAEKLKGKGVSEDQVTLYLEYAAQFLSNLGNYKSFGDKKFIPKLTPEQFSELIHKGVNDSEAIALYERVKEPLFDVSKGLLGWPEKGHLSSYYINSSSILKEEIEKVNSALAEKGIMPENTRVEKVSASEFVVHVASAEITNKTGYYPDTIEENGIKVSFKFGDHSKEFKEIVANLEQARKHVANDTQGRLVDYYIESFKTGSMNAHKKSQIEWVKDLQPFVESNIGFIETYRDPSGVRGEWEGLVAMVNKDRTEKFGSLVNNATSLIEYLPWDKVYEKDKFTPPDFTSLEVLTFAGSGIPAGINIPNYDDVRLNIGFKNVSLGNVLSANPRNPKKAEVITFINADLQEKFKRWREEAFEVQVGLHELLGHGTGKLLQETSPGVFNFDRKAVNTDTYYKPSDTWGSLFGITAGSFEECRAELVALYLILKHPLEVLPIFGIKDSDEQKDVILVATVLMCRAGLLALEFYDPAAKKWGQPHMQARFGIFKTLNQAGVCTLKYSDASTYDDLELVIHESKLHNIAVEALGEFLLSLHVNKCTANVKEGLDYYYNKTKVEREYEKFRPVVLSKKLPRKQLIQANTLLSHKSVEVKEYDESEVGLIQSFYERAI